MRRVSWMVVVVATLFPQAASADGWISPFLGVNFDGGTPEGTQPTTYGIGFGSMGGGVFGFETELAVTPGFFGDASGQVLGDNTVFTWMGNVVIGAPVGGTHGPGVRPFVTGGLGLIRRHVQSVGEIVEVSTNGFGFDVGAGVMVFFSDAFGARADFRYYRNFSLADLDIELVDKLFVTEESAFSFSRFTGALVIRF